MQVESWSVDPPSWTLYCTRTQAQAGTERGRRGRRKRRHEGLGDLHRRQVQQLDTGNVRNVTESEPGSRRLLHPEERVHLAPVPCPPSASGTWGSIEPTHVGPFTCLELAYLRGAPKIEIFAEVDTNSVKYNIWSIWNVLARRRRGRRTRRRDYIWFRESNSKRNSERTML